MEQGRIHGLSRCAWRCIVICKPIPTSTSMPLALSQALPHLAKDENDEFNDKRDETDGRLTDRASYRGALAHLKIDKLVKLKMVSYELIYSHHFNQHLITLNTAKKQSVDSKLLVYS